MVVFINIIVVVLLAFAAFCVAFNWATIVVKARRQRAGQSGNISMVFIAPQIVAFNGYFISKHFADGWVPVEFFWSLVLLDPSFLLLVAMPFVFAWQRFASLFRKAA